MKIYAPEVQHFKITDTKNNSFKYNGWPTVCRDERGVLYAVASSMRMSHVDPAGKNCMYVSFNEGKTWTKPIVVNDSYVDDRDTGICYMGGGKMIMSWFSVAPQNYMDHLQEYDWFDPVDLALAKGYSDSWKLLDPDYYKSLTGSFVRMSDDYGVTWSEPVRVPVTAPHGPCVCSDGTLVYMGNVMDRNRKPRLDENGNPVRFPVTVYTSRDGGYNWELAGEVPDGVGYAGNAITSTHTFEPHVVELPSGRLLGAIRTHSVEMDPEFTVFTTYSDDKGKTWSPPKGIGVDGSPPHLMVHSSGAVICSYSCRTEGVRCERAAVSYDDGETWSEDYALDHRIGNQKDMGYPASVELSDGSILTVYYQANPGQGWTNINCTRWRLISK